MILNDILNKTHQLIIIGSGPAAHTAAIYAGRAQLSPIMFEGEFAGGVAAGGQLTTTTEVENFPGFPNGITGPDLMNLMRNQSLNCGTHIFTKTIDSIDFNQKPIKITGSFGSLYSNSVIIATGATAKRLNINNENKYWQKGISACAVCDGALPLFRNKPLVVIGGGDSAVEESMYLTKYASKITVLVRKDHLRASKIMQTRLLKKENVDIMWNTECIEAVGNDLLSQLKIKNNITNKTNTIDANGLFYAIGHMPNTEFLNNQLNLNDSGYIITKPGTTTTNIPGVFACGDVQDQIYRQAVTAAGSGCMAALDCEKFLTEEEFI